jgi:hypothetical protein
MHSCTSALGSKILIAAGEPQISVSNALISGLTPKVVIICPIARGSIPGINMT